jgi:hypothetical protein
MSQQALLVFLTYPEAMADLRDYLTKKLRCKPTAEVLAVELGYSHMTFLYADKDEAEEVYRESTKFEHDGLIETRLVSITPNCECRLCTKARAGHIDYTSVAGDVDRDYAIMTLSKGFDTSEAVVRGLWQDAEDEAAHPDFVFFNVTAVLLDRAKRLLAHQEENDKAILKGRKIEPSKHN